MYEKLLKIDLFDLVLKTDFTWFGAKTIHTYIYIIFESGSWPI